MDFASFIYVDEYAYGKYKKISKMIKKKKKYIKDSFFVIILNEYTSKLEFEDWIYLLQSHYAKRPPLIVGIAEDYDSAQEVCAYMIKNCIDKVGNLDYLSFIASFEKDNDNKDENPRLIIISGGELK